MSPVRPTVQVVGRRLEREDHRLRDFLTRIAQPHEWFEADSAAATALFGDRRLADPILPVLVDGEKTYEGATVELIATAWRQLVSPEE